MKKLPKCLPQSQVSLFPDPAASSPGVGTPYSCRPTAILGQYEQKRAGWRLSMSSLHLAKQRDASVVLSLIKKETRK